MCGSAFFDKSHTPSSNVTSYLPGSSYMYNKRLYTVQRRPSLRYFTVGYKNIRNRGLGKGETMSSDRDVSKRDIWESDEATVRSMQ